MSYLTNYQFEELPEFNRFENTVYELPQELYDDAFQQLIESDQSDWDFIEDYDEREFDDKSFGSFETTWM